MLKFSKPGLITLLVVIVAGSFVIPVVAQTVYNQFVDDPEKGLPPEQQSGTFFNHKCGRSEPDIHLFGEHASSYSGILGCRCDCK